MIPDPRQLLQPQSSNAYGASPEDVGEGVANQLKQMMAMAVAVSEAAPDLAEPMRQVRQLAMRSLLQAQSGSSQGGNAGGMTPS